MPDEVLQQAELDEVFLNNPIKEVAFEIRYPLNLTIQRDLGDFQAAIFQAYPKVTREYGQFEKKEPVVVHTFSNKEDTTSLKVADDRFIVVSTRYQNFEAFKAEALAQGTTFCQMFKVNEFTRVGLRYVNNIEVPKEDNAYVVTRYLRPYVDIERIKAGGPFKFSLELSMKKEACFLTSRTAFLLKSPSPDKGIYLLDLDAYIQDPTYIADLDSVMEILHEQDQREFLLHITSSYKQVMRGAQ